MHVTNGTSGMYESNSLLEAYIISRTIELENAVVAATNQRIQPTARTVLFTELHGRTSRVLPDLPP